MIELLPVLVALCGSPSLSKCSLDGVSCFKQQRGKNQNYNCNLDIVVEKRVHKKVSRRKVKFAIHHPEVR